MRICGGKPLIWHTLEHARQSNLDMLLVCTGTRNPSHSTLSLLFPISRQNTLKHTAPRVYVMSLFVLYEYLEDDEIKAYSEERGFEVFCIPGITLLSLSLSLSFSLCFFVSRTHTLSLHTHTYDIHARHVHI